MKCSFKCLITFLFLGGEDGQNRDFDFKNDNFGNQLELCSWVRSCQRLWHIQLNRISEILHPVSVSVP